MVGHSEPSLRAVTSLNSIEDALVERDRPLTPCPYNERLFSDLEQDMADRVQHDHVELVMGDLRNGAVELNVPYRR